MFRPIGEATISVDLKRLDAEGQAWLDWLLDKNNEGHLTSEERQELQHLVAQGSPLKIGSRRENRKINATRGDDYSRVFTTRVVGHRG